MLNLLSTLCILQGTLLAIAVTFCSYIGYAAMVGGCYLSEASGIEEEYWAAMNNNDSIIHFDNCDVIARNGTPCSYGSSNDYQVKKLFFSKFHFLSSRYFTRDSRHVPDLHWLWSYDRRLLFERGFREPGRVLGLSEQQRYDHSL